MIYIHLVACCSFLFLFLDIPVLCIFVKLVWCQVICTIIGILISLEVVGLPNVWYAVSPFCVWTLVGILHLPSSFFIHFLNRQRYFHHLWFVLMCPPFFLLDLKVILASQTEKCTSQTSHVTCESHEFGLMLPTVSPRP